MKLYLYETALGKIYSSAVTENTRLAQPRIHKF